VKGAGMKKLFLFIFLLGIINAVYAEDRLMQEGDEMGQMRIISFNLGGSYSSEKEMSFDFSMNFAPIIFDILLPYKDSYFNTGLGIGLTLVHYIYMQNTHYWFF
jgi:hypothetical protein